MTRLLIVDDHEVVRNGLCTALASAGFIDIQTAATVAQARSKVAALNPDAVIVDLNLPDGSGFEIVQWVRKFSKKTAIIVLSLNSGEQFVQASQLAGANAYLSKSQSLQEITSAIAFALVNPESFSSKFTARHSDHQNLTARELDVLQLMAAGSSNQGICSTLFISSATVKTHVSAILRKLDAENRTQAVAKARTIGLLLQ